MLVGNVRIEPINSMYREASFVGSSAYLLQRDRSKVLAILMSEQRHHNETNLDAPKACITMPMTVAECIGKIEDVTTFIRFLVNVANNCTAYVDFDVMKANDVSYLLSGLAMHLFLLVNGDSMMWMNKTGGGNSAPLEFILVF